MPTDTLGATGRRRSADPIGRARHPAECRPGHEEKRRRIRREIVPGKVASDRFDRICKRGKRLPAERGISKAATKSISRRSGTPTRHERQPHRPDNFRLPVDSSGTHIAGTPAGSVSAEEVRQRAKRPSVPRKPTHDRPDVVPAFPAGRRCGFGKRFPGPFLACYRFLAYL